MKRRTAVQKSNDIYRNGMRAERRIAMVQTSNEFVIPKAPSPTQIQSITGQAIDAIESVRDKLVRETDACRAAHTQAEAQGAKLAARESDIELRQAKVAIEADRISQLQDQHTVALKELETRDRKYEADQRSLEDRMANINAHAQQLQSEQEALTQSRKEYDARAEKLEETRQALSVMQAQVTEDQKALADQRNQILNQLGPSTATKAPAIPEVPQAEMVPANVAEPKPAEKKSAKLFRKLRRDSKRRAIGV